MNTLDRLVEITEKGKKVLEVFETPQRRENLENAVKWVEWFENKCHELAKEWDCDDIQQLGKLVLDKINKCECEDTKKMHDHLQQFPKEDQLWIVTDTFEEMT